MLRLSRVARLFVQFRTLWELVRGLLNSGWVLLWSFSLIILLVFVFAVTGIEVVGANQELRQYEETKQIATSFGTLWGAMLNLVSFWLLDGFIYVFVPAVGKVPYLGLYFLIFIKVISVACMKLLTAIMVQNAIATAAHDRESKAAWELQRRKKMVPKLAKPFMLFDVDNSGEVTKDELLFCPKQAKDALREVASCDCMAEIFDVLDVDGGGSISIDKFCSGLLKISKQPGKPIELARMVKQLDKVLRLIWELIDWKDECTQG